MTPPSLLLSVLIVMAAAFTVSYGQWGTFPLQAAIIIDDWNIMSYVYISDQLLTNTSINITVADIFPNPIINASVNNRILCVKRGQRDLLEVEMDSYAINVKIDTNKPVMFIIHGWMDNFMSRWVQDTVNDASTLLDVNVCAVDWANLAHFNYSESVDNTLIVSDQTTKFIKILNQLNVPSKSITLVGHDLGAHICGQIGQNLHGEIGQIYGLEPAGAMITTPPGRPLSFRLDKTDAEYVQFLLTAKGSASVSVGEGHENFYVNGGSAPQPNCGSITNNTGDAELVKILFCSHFHAYNIFRLSMNPLLVYPARLCLSWADYIAGRCFLNRMTRAGIYSTQQGGDFYLKTSALAPFIMF